MGDCLWPIRPSCLFRCRTRPALRRVNQRWIRAHQHLALASGRRVLRLCRNPCTRGILRETQYRSRSKTSVRRARKTPGRRAVARMRRAGINVEYAYATAVEGRRPRPCGRVRARASASPLRRPGCGSRFWASHGTHFERRAPARAPEPRISQQECSDATDRASPSGPRRGGARLAVPLLAATAPKFSSPTAAQDGWGDHWR